MDRKDMMKMNLGVSPAKTKILGILCLLILLATLLYWRYTSTPSYLAQQTFAALERKDVQTLLALADPEEVQQLGLTPKAVSAILDKTFWNGAPLKGGTLQATVDKFPTDQSHWTCRWNDERFSRDPAHIEIIDHPSRGWKLNLSHLLYAACWHQQGDKGRILYYKLAESNGVKGLRTQEGVYDTMEGIHSKIILIYGPDYNNL